jgi:hypothetical protein
MKTFLLIALAIGFAVFVIALWRDYSKPEEPDSSIPAELIDRWEYYGYDDSKSGGVIYRGVPATKPLGKMRYAGVFLLESGEEITLAADRSLEDIPLHQKGNLKCEEGRLIEFLYEDSEKAES